VTMSLWWFKAACVVLNFIFFKKFFGSSPTSPFQKSRESQLFT
jgi:hypothetical protein